MIVDGIVLVDVDTFQLVAGQRVKQPLVVLQLLPHLFLLHPHRRRLFAGHIRKRLLPRRSGTRGEGCRAVSLCLQLCELELFAAGRFHMLLHLPQPCRLTRQLIVRLGARRAVSTRCSYRWRIRALGGCARKVWERRRGKICCRWLVGVAGRGRRVPSERRLVGFGLHTWRERHGRGRERDRPRGIVRSIGRDQRWAVSRVHCRNRRALWVWLRRHDPTVCIRWDVIPGTTGTGQPWIVRRAVHCTLLQR